MEQLIIGKWPSPPNMVTPEWVASLEGACDDGKEDALRLLAGRSLPWYEAYAEAKRLLQADEFAWLERKVGLAGNGSGYGFGDGSGSGYGYGYDYGYGYGYGSGHDYGYGYGYGSGHGYGYGSGYGYGYGFGSGSGYGYGYGSDHGGGGVE